MRILKADAERFWKHVACHLPHNGSCWLWTGSTKGTGGKRYGNFSMSRAGERKWLMAHRVSYQLAYGPIPEGHVILHACDEPLCCNPAHLSSGTQSENMQDMVRKGRQGRGQRIRRTIAYRIRQDRAYGLTYDQLSQRYQDVSPRMIVAICLGEWRPKKSNSVKVSIPTDFSKPVRARRVTS